MLQEPKLESAVPSPDARGPYSEPDGETLAGYANLTAPEAETKGRDLRLVREIVETILLTIVIFLAINIVTGRFRVEGPSMRPNLHTGQYLIISKIVYKLHPPERGDIIVFHHPRGGGRDLIKRIVGLPGEMIAIRQGQVFVNDTLLEEPYVLDRGRYSDQVELGQDEFYVLGDNRRNSDDSHNWGELGLEQIVGKAWLSYWPPTEWGGLLHHDFQEWSAVSGQGVEFGANGAMETRNQGRK